MLTLLVGVSAVRPRGPPPLEVPCGTGRVANLTILTTLPYVHNATRHLTECLQAIGQNARSDRVARLVVITDSHSDDDDPTTALRKSVWQATGGTTQHLSKLSARVHRSQPTYAAMFRYSNEYPGLVAVMNADVVLRNLEFLDEDAFDVPPLFALVLSVVPPSPPFECRERFIVDKCAWRFGAYTWDVTIIKAPLVAPRYDLLEALEPVPVYMNQQGGETRAGHFLAGSGYHLFNPCRTIRAEHWHCSAQTHHGAVRVDRGLPYVANGTVVRPQNVSRGIRCPP